MSSPSLFNDSKQENLRKRVHIGDYNHLNPEHRKLKTKEDAIWNSVTCLLFGIFANCSNPPLPDLPIECWYKIVEYCRAQFKRDYCGYRSPLYIKAGNRVHIKPLPNFVDSQIGYFIYGVRARVLNNIIHERRQEGKLSQRTAIAQRNLTLVCSLAWNRCEKKLECGCVKCFMKIAEIMCFKITDESIIQETLVAATIQLKLKVAPFGTSRLTLLKCLTCNNKLCVIPR
jgi:hypothetical protein